MCWCYICIRIWMYTYRDVEVHDSYANINAWKT